MPEDKGKSVKAPKSKSNDDFAPQLVKSKSEIPKNAVLKIDSDGEEYWEVETKHEETKKKMYSPSSGKKSTGTPRKKDPEKSSTFGSTVQRYKLPPPEVIPPEQTGLYGGISTYEKIDPAKQWGADYGITTVETPDAEGRYTNTSRKYNIDKEGREIVYDLANPLNSFKDGKFTPTYTGRTIDDIRKEYTTQKIETPAMSGVDKANPNYKGSLMMPGTKATRIAGGGGGEFNQRNIADVPNALSTAPVGYIEQKYDTQGNPIVTPNVGVQMNTKNITPLRKGEMEVGRMYNIDNPIEIKGKFAKGGIVSKIKGYYDGGPVYNPNMNIDGTYGDSNSSYKPIDTFGSGVVGMNDQYTAQNNMQAKKAIDENKKKANQKAKEDAVNKNAISSIGSSTSGSNNKTQALTNIGATAAGAGSSYIDVKNKDERGRYTNTGAAVGSNALKYAALGASAGSVVGPWGTLIGGAAGGIGGAIYGGVKGEKDKKSIKSSKEKQKNEIITANNEIKQQQAIAARNNQEENPTITNPYDENNAMFNSSDELIKMYNGGVVRNAKMMYAKGGVVSKIKGYTLGGNTGYGILGLDTGVVGQNDPYAAQKAKDKQDEIDAAKKKANQQKARNVANGIGEGMGGIGSAYYNSQPAQNEGESARNAGLAAASQMGPIGGMIGGIAAIGDKIGKPIRNRSEKVDASGELLDEGKAKRNAAIGITFSPSKRLTYEGGLTDITGQKYIDSIEKKTKAQLAEVNAANVASKQQQAIAARNNQEENPTITNPYNLSGVTFDENQNMILADGQQFDKNRPMMNKGGVVGKIKNMYADGGDIKGKGTAKSDSIMAEVKEGSFVVPAENAELAKGIRKLYLKAPNKKANLKQEEGEAVKLSNGEHLFTPEENEYLESIGIDLEDLAPNAEHGKDEMAKGGLTANKARMILHDKKVHGKPLTDKQRKFFGAISNGASIKGYAAGGDIDEVDPIKELARLNKEKEDAEKSAKAESDAEKSARDKKIADFKAKVESYDRKADRKNKASEWDKKRNDSKTKLDALNKSYEEASKEFKAANTPTAEQKAKGIKAGTLTDTQRKYQENLLKKIQEAKSEFDNAERTYNYIKDDNNYDASGNIKTKPKAATVAPKAETKPSVVTENVPTTKPSLKAPKVTTSKVTVDNLPTKDLSLQGLKQDAELKVANQAAMQEASIANAPTRQAVINDANVTSNENYLASKPKSKNAWADKLSNIDPTAFVGIGQSALGLNMLGKEKRPIDKAVIDPTYNAAVNRAQQDALFGLTPEQRFMAEQDIQGGLNDAKFEGLNSSASDSFNRNRAAINDAWKNKLGLKQADAEMRMNKQKYADVMAADRATILAANRRQAYNDAMNTFQQKQQAGSELIGAGLANTIGAYRFRQDQQARLKADEARGYSLNNYNPTT